MHLSPLNLGAVYNVEEIGVSWCQILMRRDMEIAETLCGEQRAGNTHLSTSEEKVKSKRVKAARAAVEKAVKSDVRAPRGA